MPCKLKVQTERCDVAGASLLDCLRSLLGNFWSASPAAAPPPPAPPAPGNQVLHPSSPVFIVSSFCHEVCRCFRALYVRSMTRVTENSACQAHFVVLARPPSICGSHRDPLLRTLSLLEPLVFPIIN